MAKQKRSLDGALFYGLTDLFKVTEASTFIHIIEKL